MRQVTQRLKDGRIEVLDVPVPEMSEHEVLILLRASLLSAGTERSKVMTGQKSLVGKARARPDQVSQVVAKARVDGVRSTIETVRARLGEPSGLGYSAAGVVAGVGSRVAGLGPGDRVACGGGNYAVHAEVVSVPGNLCVKLPSSVEFEAGAFATVGAIAMHGMRQADVRLGERVAVIGLGLVGQLAGMLLRAAGVTVVGIDLTPRLCELAMKVGAADLAFERSGLDGELPGRALECDAVIITAATPSSDPIALAARLARDRARVVVVGDVGLDVPRAPYYDKEIDIRLSRSYGPGRYDPEYEERGLDYPVGYVRWTERRNMQAFVDLIGTGRIDVGPLIAHRFPIADAKTAFETLVENDGSPLGIVLEYEHELDAVPDATAPSAPAPTSRRNSPMRAGLIGTGSFAQRILIPAVEAAG
ncbi:MAG: hypothetical protein QOE44_2335, partial [Solirubrobacteraceae bacterium]|nr:hypothetical protein [Solirubrobacteraceae bacterium]